MSIDLFDRMAQTAERCRGAHARTNDFQRIAPYAVVDEIVDASQIEPSNDL